MKVAKLMKVAIMFLLTAALVMPAGAVEGTPAATPTVTPTATPTATQTATATPRTGIVTWSPQVVDYIYVNNSINETITYSITLAASSLSNNWTVDGVAVNGTTAGATSSYTHTWTNSSIGSHTIIYKGGNGSGVEFRWYANVYQIGTYSGGNIFDIIDDALEYHVTDIKIRMFKYKVAKHGGNSELVAQKVNILHDSIAKRQMTREALRLELKAGNITSQEYTAAIKQAQRDAKADSQLSRSLAKIARDELRDNRAGDDLEQLSEAESDSGISNKPAKVTDGKKQSGDGSSDGNKGSGNGNKGSSDSNKGSSGNNGDGKSSDTGKSNNAGSKNNNGKNGKGHSSD